MRWRSHTNLRLPRAHATSEGDHGDLGVSGQKFKRTVSRKRAIGEISSTTLTESVAVAAAAAASSSRRGRSFFVTAFIVAIDFVCARSGGRKLSRGFGARPGGRRTSPRFVSSSRI